MAKRHFLYTREEEKKKLDENGKAIPIKDAEGKQTGVETYKVSFTDSFDITRVIRTHTLEEGEKVIVLLDDGHETTEKVPVLKNKNKKGPVGPSDIVEEKQRVWVQSEIVLRGEDVRRYFDTLATVEV